MNSAQDIEGSARNDNCQKWIAGLLIALLDFALALLLLLVPAVMIAGVASAFITHGFWVGLGVLVGALVVYEVLLVPRQH